MSPPLNPFQLVMARDEGKKCVTPKSRGWIEIRRGHLLLLISAAAIVAKSSKARAKTFRMLRY
jgi:hypothetical protein